MKTNLQINEISDPSYEVLTEFASDPTDEDLLMSFDQSHLDLFN